MAAYTLQKVRSAKFKVGKQVESATCCERATILKRCEYGTDLASPARMPPYDLIERTRCFALEVRRFCKRLPKTDEAQEAAQQLRKAANSTRSNYRAARKASSRPMFRSKLQIAREEADECVDWLQYLKDSRIQHKPAVLQEAREIASILCAAVKTAKRNSDPGTL
jgi:four helix bundle protein